MNTIIIVLAIAIYIIIMLGMSIIRPAHRGINTPKEAFEIVFWPIWLIFNIIKTSIFILHEFLSLVLLCFGSYYRLTEIYNKISEWSRS
jgi:hypothetical protein